MLPLIIKREFSTFLGAKAMRISTAILVILFLVAGIVGRIFLGGDDADAAPEKPEIAVTSDVVELESYLENLGVNVKNVGSQDPADAARETDLLVLSGDPALPTVTSSSDSGSGDPLLDVVVLAATNRLLDQAGVLTDQLSGQIAQLQYISVHSVGSGNAIEQNPIGYLAGMASIMILMMITIMGVSAISAGIVEEKASRVVEILLTTVRPRTLLLGKILGIGSALLVIFTFYLAGIIGGLAIAGLLENIGMLGKLGLWGFLPMLLMWIVLGYFTNASITGGLASTVSRQEDIGAVQTPLIFLQMVPLYIAIYLVPFQPDATITHVLSYIPFFSPYLMPMRATLGGVELWEQILAVGLTLAVIPLLGMLAGKIYERSILHTGERLKLGEVLRKAA